MFPQVNLQPGSNNTQAVKQLQDYLVANGYMTQAQVNTGYGTYGPQTTKAVAALQQRTGVNNSTGVGYFGPRTIAAISGQQTQPSNPAPIAPQTQPKTQSQLDTEYSSAAAAHPALVGNSPESITYATTTGDYSALVNSAGKPFSDADQASALAQGTAAVSPFYQAEQKKETEDANVNLAGKQAEYQKYLDDQATKFQTEKTNQDQTAANQGVLFSGGRAQKLQQLGDTYTKNDAYARTKQGNEIGNTARDFGYKFGDSAANGLSQYYSLGTQNYNPNVTSGGVTPGGLSSVYSANQGFQGTQVNAAKVAGQKRAAGLLANKGNKLVGSGYTNQF